MINSLTDRLLSRYDSSSYKDRNRAQFILYLIFTLMILAPSISVFFIYIHIDDPFYTFQILLGIVGPVMLAFVFTLGITKMLIRGYVSLAGNMLLVIWQAALWAVSFLAKEDPIIRIDSIVMIIATMTMMPIIIVYKKMLFVFYTAVNIIILYIFMFGYKSELNLPPAVFTDYLSVFTISFVFSGIVSYKVFSINSKSLEKAESEIAERQKTEEQRNRLQMQLLQSQKLESVGLLAGGVAHDFNNMLAAVQGYAELALENYGADYSTADEIAEIIKVSKKARDLTQQLLAFARVQPLDIKNLNLNDVVSDFTGMLARIIRSNIIISKNLCDNPGSFEGDPVQIEQVILNLVMNAQDAMPEGGEIAIETMRVDLTEESVKEYGNMTPGAYIQLSVRDTGTGIDPIFINDIFNPFYTTKKFGKGTGLGLSTVYGIVIQHKGYITVKSEPGKGTAFSIYFPVKDETFIYHSSAASDINEFKGTETILVVEDTAEVRNLIEKILKKKGYTTLIADNPASALSIASSYPGIIHMIITDVMMPDLDGMQLYNKISEIRPGICIVYMSGYASDIISGNDHQAEGFNFLQKPFSILDLTRKIREILDATT